MKPVRPRPAAGKVRIIGGRWRGTRLDVPDLPGLRPSSDRVRETLFNWLMPALPGARVLDLFAGTGALGLEAVSRGAASAVLVERDPTLATALQATVVKLDAADKVAVARADALGWLSGARNQAFDIIFLDPPFAEGLWARALQALEPVMSGETWIYVESPPEQAPAMPADCALHREGRTREVRFALYRHVSGTLRDDITTAAAE